MIEMIDTIGIESIIIILAAILLVFWIQRKRIKDLIWEHVEEIEDAASSFLVSELSNTESMRRKWAYNLYDKLPPALKVFMSKEAFKKFVDRTFETLRKELETKPGKDGKE